MLDASNQRSIASGRGQRRRDVVEIARCRIKPRATSVSLILKRVRTSKQLGSSRCGLSCTCRQSPPCTGLRKSASQCTTGRATSGQVACPRQPGNTDSAAIPWRCRLSSQASWHHRSSWWKCITPAASVSPKRTWRLSSSQWSDSATGCCVERNGRCSILILTAASTLCREPETSHNSKPVGQHQSHDPVGDESTAAGHKGCAAWSEGDQAALMEGDCTQQEQSSCNNWAEHMPLQ